MGKSQSSRLKLMSNRNTAKWCELRPFDLHVSQYVAKSMVFQSASPSKLEPFEDCHPSTHNMFQKTARVKAA